MKQVRTIAWSRMTGGPATRPLDAALECIGAYGDTLLAIYIVAMLPMSAGMLLLIDAIAAEHRTGLVIPCLLLTAGMFWRWAGLSILQCHVASHLSGRKARLAAGQWAVVLFGRLIGMIAVTWGGFAVFPAYWGAFCASFLTPAMLDDDADVCSPVRTVFRWTTRAIGRLSKIGMIMALLLLLAIIATIGLHGILLGLLLPSLLNIDPSALSITFSSAAWLMSVCYGLFVLLDFFWTVASVFVFHDLQSRRLGNDMVARLASLREQAA